MLTPPWAGNLEMRNKVGHERRITRAQFQTPTGSNSIKTEDPRWNNQHFIPPCNSSTYLLSCPGLIHEAKPFFLKSREWENSQKQLCALTLLRRRYRESKHALVSSRETELSYGSLTIWVRFWEGHYTKPARHPNTGKTLPPWKDHSGEKLWGKPQEVHFFVTERGWGGVTKGYWKHCHVNEHGVPLCFSWTE